MGVAFSATPPWRSSSQHKWLPIAILGLGYVIIIVSLSGCYAIANARDHLSGQPVPPAISMLGDQMPEHALFLVGFILLVLCLAYCLFFRAGQIDCARPRSIINLTALIIALLGLLAVIVMAAIPTSSSLGEVHLIAAGVGMLFLSLYGVLTSAMCLLWSLNPKLQLPDPKVSPPLRFVCYCVTACTALLGPILFGVWLSNVDNTLFEWVGVVNVFTSFLPMFVLFALHEHKGSALEEYQSERSALISRM